MTNVLRSARQAWKPRLDTVASLALFAMTFFMYVSTMAPTVAEIYDDTLEFPLVVQRLAIAHPTGYPLYTLLGKLLGKLLGVLPLGDVAYRLHLMSGLLAACAVAILYLAARRLGFHPLGSLAAALMLAVSPVFWSQALVAEVYTLNSLFVVTALALVAAWGEAGQRRFAVLGALCFTLGLSLTHHRTMALLFPALAIHLLLAHLGRANTLRHPFAKTNDGASVTGPQPRWWPLRLLILFAVPFLLYLYIPLRGMVTSSLDGTYVNTVAGFVSWVSGGAYTVFLSSNPFNQPALSASAYGSLLVEQVGWGGVLLALLGAAWLLCYRLRTFILLALSWLAVVLFVYVYRVADAPVFLVPSFIMIALAAGAGVHALAAGYHAASAWAARLASARLASVAVLALLVPGMIFAGNIHRLDRSHDWAVHNYAVDVLSQPLEPNASVVGILGEMTLLRYFQETQAMRPDIETVAADTDVTRLAAVRRLVDAGQPVYLTRSLDGLEKTYSLRSVGPLIRVLRPDASAGAPLLGAVPSQAVFGERIALLNYRMTGLSSELAAQAFPQRERPGTVESGGRLRLALSWQASKAVAGDYQVTVRLKTPTGRLLWQSDGRPVHGNYPTSAWRAGEIVNDVYDLSVPVGTPPGLYDVEIGLYDGASLQLLPVTGRAELLALSPVSVVRPDVAPELDSLPAASPQRRTGLTIPRGRFDYSLEHLGIQRVVRSNLQNEFTLYGFGLSETPLVPGQSVDVALLWQASRTPAADRVVFIQLIDKNGAPWASHESQPGEGSYATRQWVRNEVIRDVHTLLLPGDMPDGTYRLEAGMYDPSGSPLTVLRLTRRSLDRVDLGTVQVRGRARSQQIPGSIQQTVNARLGKAALLVGYDSGIGAIGGASNAVLAARPGETIHLRLVWQAVEPTQTSYTVFVHLQDPRGIVVSQDDAVPGRGTLPTTSWVRGEVLLDSYTLVVPAGALTGTYQIELGLYDAITGSRLPVWDSSGASVGDSLILTKVRIERTP